MMIGEGIDKIENIVYQPDNKLLITIADGQRQERGQTKFSINNSNDTRLLDWYKACLAMKRWGTTTMSD